MCALSSIYMLSGSRVVDSILSGETNVHAMRKIQMTHEKGTVQGPITPDSPVSTVCADEAKFQGILHTLGPFLGLSGKSDKSDAMVHTTGTIFMADVQDNAFLATVQ